LRRSYTLYIYLIVDKVNGPLDDFMQAVSYGKCKLSNSWPHFPIFLITFPNTSFVGNFDGIFTYLRASIIYITPVGHNALAPSPPPTPCVNFDLCHKLAAVCGKYTLVALLW